MQTPLPPPFQFSIEVYDSVLLRVHLKFAEKLKMKEKTKIENWKKQLCFPFFPHPIPNRFESHWKKSVLGWSTYPNTEMLGHPVTVSHQVPDSCGFFF